MHDLTVALQHTGLDMEQQGIMRLLAGLDLAHHGTVRRPRNKAGGTCVYISSCEGWVCVSWQHQGSMCLLVGLDLAHHGTGSAPQQR